MICKNLDGADQVLLKCDLEFLNIESAKSWITKIQPGQASFVMAGEDQTTAWTDFVLAAEPLSVQTCSHGMYEYSFREHTVRIPENIHRSFLWARQWGHLGPERAARYSDAIQRALIMLPFIQSARNTISAGIIPSAFRTLLMLGKFYRTRSNSQIGLRCRTSRDGFEATFARLYVKRNIVEFITIANMSRR